MAPEDQHDFLQLLNTRAFSRLYGCDVYYAFNDGHNDLSYWRGWFGFDRKENVKGIVKLIMEESL